MTVAEQKAELWHLQVALVCGLDDAAKKDLMKGPSHGGSHLHNLLKFLTVRSEKDGSRTGITLLGGPVDAAADGDPSRCQSTPDQPPLGNFWVKSRCPVYLRRGSAGMRWDRSRLTGRWEERVA